MTAKAASTISIEFTVTSRSILFVVSVSKSFRITLRRTKRKQMAKESKKAQAKVKKVMTEMKEGKLHSGSKKGPVVTNPKQGIAIALSEARKKGLKVGKKK
jgi:hypothetical protein